MVRIEAKKMEIEELRIASEGSPPFSTVIVAVSGTKNSRYALKWALEKFVPEGKTCFRLVHVRSKITMVPTPMGNYLPVSKVREDIASAYRKEVEWKTDLMLRPYKKMCAGRQVEVEALVIEADDVAEAIAREVTKFSIGRLVIGSSSGNLFTRKSKDSSISSKISRNVPSFCTVYVVSKGKLSSVHASTSGTDERTNDIQNSSIASLSFSSHSSSAKSGSSPNVTFPTRSTCIDDAMSSGSNMSEINCSDSMFSSYKSSQTGSPSCISDQASKADDLEDSSLTENKVNIEYELQRLRYELGHLRGLCETAHNESVDTSKQLNDLSARHMEEAVRRIEIKSREGKTRENARQEWGKREAAEMKARFIREFVVRETLQRKINEESSAHEANEKLRLDETLLCPDEQYKKYTWKEIESATSSFSETLRIGMGANGVVYKGIFHHTFAAVKVLHSNEGHRTKQFKQEIDILGRIHHPHLLLLLGACPDPGCLVYEYMENGSLDDRLQCKNNTSPLPWYHRFRIAWEVTSALVFLHSSKPEPIVHRDLKPANILLDHNYLSKIGDVGLSTILPAVNFSGSTMYKDTAPAGTFFYIDPEYQRTGLVSTKSDTYGLGMVILQLLTAKSPMGLTYIMETALEDGCLKDILDSGAGEWPMEETQELSLLGLNCAELRRKDRPDLKDQVLPLLERLKRFADKAHYLAYNAPVAPPDHFICPICQEVMDDPCVASDGYTYERKAIKLWHRTNDKSPMTNMPLPDKILIPNHSLLSAIKDWKSRSL